MLNSSLTEPADAVEELWTQAGEAPDLKALLAEHPHWSAHELRTALLYDQQFRGQSTQPWSTEHYLSLAQSLATDEDATLDLIYGECRGRIRQGDPPQLEELVGRFPHLRQRLERQLEIAAWFEDTDDELLPDDEDGSSETDCDAIRFGDYELCEEIARGGMGVIYRALHRKLNRTVALKMIRPERLNRASDLRRFKNETQIIAQLDHPNIIPILHVDKVDGIHFFTMRMVEGRDLELRRSEYLDDVRRAAALVLAVADAIHYAHQHGVLHRDLKPSNVLVNDSGVPFVVDFGLACHLPEETALKLSDEFLGTPCYAAPELLQEKPQPPSVAVDVYGLGAILYVLITGQPPFAGRNSFEVWNKIRNSQPQPPHTLNARVDPELEAICLQAMEKEPASRYESAAVLAADLQRYLLGQPVAARPIAGWQRRVRWIRKHPIGPAFALAAVLAILGLLTMIVVQSMQLREQIEKTEAAVIEAESFRQAWEVAVEKAADLSAELPSLP